MISYQDAGNLKLYFYFEDTEEIQESRNVHENSVSLVNYECVSSNWRTASQTFSEKVLLYNLTEPGWVSLATSSQKENQKLKREKKFLSKKYEEEKEINKKNEAKIQDLEEQKDEVINENEDLKNQHENDKKEIEHLNKTIADQDEAIKSHIQIKLQIKKIHQDKSKSDKEKLAEIYQIM